MNGVFLMTKVFFGYPSHPAGPGEVMRATADGLSAQQLDAVTWEDLRVGGRVVIDQVLEAIETSDVAVFDVTYLNENVLFEAGHAIARGKPVWLTIDITVAEAPNSWNELAVLKPIGYIAYRNSAELLARFLAEDPVGSLTPAYDDLIEPALPDVPEPHQTVLYCPTFEPFEAADRLSKYVDDRRSKGVRVLASDPKESSFESITWFAPVLAKSAGVIVHFAGASRNRAQIYNRRHAFVAGMASGMECPLLLLLQSAFG
jgi:hypothetical protein